MSCKVLPFCKDPPVKTYHHHAFTFGILLAENQNIAPWFYSNYIQLVYELKYYTLNFTDSCFFNSTMFNRQLVFKQTLRRYGLRSSDFFRDAIDDGYYVSAFVDEYYIPNKRPYHKFSNLHDICIFGYSGTAFNIIGYDQYGIYSEGTASFDDIDLSDPDNIFLLKLKPNTEYNLDLALMRDLLRYYLDPQSIQSIYRSVLADYTVKYYGVDSYKIFKDQIDILGEHPEKADIRPFELLREHKQCMYDRLVYLNENSIADLTGQIPRYKDILDRTKTLKRVFMKFAIRKDTGMLPSILNDVQKVKEDEIGILSEVLKAIAGQYPR